MSINQASAGNGFKPIALLYEVMKKNVGLITLISRLSLILSVLYVFSWPASR